jgi:hypothetical protein
VTNGAAGDDGQAVDQAAVHLGDRHHALVALRERDAQSPPSEQGHANAQHLARTQHRMQLAERLDVHRDLSAGDRRGWRRRVGARDVPRGAQVGGRPRHGLLTIASRLPVCANTVGDGDRAAG